MHVVSWDEIYSAYSVSNWKKKDDISVFCQNVYGVN